VGSTTAQRIVDLELADVVLTDIFGRAAGRESAGHDGVWADHTDGFSCHRQFPTRDRRLFPRRAGSDVVVITAGFPRKPGMSRDDLLKANYDVVKAVVEQIVKHSPNCIIIVVTNPLDAMAQAALKVSGFPKHRVLGMAGVLDSARMSTFVAMECKVSVENVHSFVLGRSWGRHGCHCQRYSTVAGIPLPDCTTERTHRRHRGAHAQGRRGDREFVEEWLGLLCAVSRGCRDGGSNSEGQKEDSAVRRIPRRRVTGSRDCS